MVDHGAGLLKIKARRCGFLIRNELVKIKFQKIESK